MSPQELVGARKRSAWPSNPFIVVVDVSETSAMDVWEMGPD